MQRSITCCGAASIGGQKKVLADAAKEVVKKLKKQKGELNQPLSELDLRERNFIKNIGKEDLMPESVRRVPPGSKYAMGDPGQGEVPVNAKVF